MQYPNHFKTSEYEGACATPSLFIQLNKIIQKIFQCGRVHVFIQGQIKLSTPSFFDLDIYLTNFEMIYDL